MHALNDAAICDMSAALVTGDGTLIVPSEICQALGLRPGDVVTFTAMLNGMVLATPWNRASTPPEYAELTAVERHPKLKDSSGALIGVIEIESGNAVSTFDAIDKLETYKSIASMQFIVLVSVGAPRARVFLRNENGIWSSRVVTGLESQIELTAIGVTVALKDLYCGPETGPVDERRIRFGFLQGQLNIPEDFDSPLPADLLKKFEGS